MNAELYLENLQMSIPLLLLLGLGLLLMLMDAFKAHKALPWVAGLGLLASAAVALPGWLQPETKYLAFNRSIYFGGIAALLHVFLCLTGVFVVFFLDDFFKRQKQQIGDIYALMCFAIIGMVLLATSNSLIILFIGLEVMSVCLYIMAGLFKSNMRSTEAGVKYFLLGAFATGFFLYGIALIYGATGTMELDSMTANQYLSGRPTPLIYLGITLMLIGFLFKVAAFPFHSWTPDVYTGSPTPLAGFMATGSKLATFVALSIFLGRFFTQEILSVQGIEEKLINVLLLLALLSMIYGNIVAVQQRNVKRILAYSSIAHTGYLMLGLAAGTMGYKAVLFYMVIYTLMTLGAFGMVAMVENKDADAELDSWKGLGLRKPWIGVAMSVFLLSLAGIPPLAGFMAKYQVFLAAIEAGYIWPSVIGILTSVVGAYYYLRVIVYMYFQKPDEATDSNQLAGSGFAAASAPLSGAMLLVVLLLVLGILPSLVSGPIDVLYSDLLPASATAAVQ